VFSPFASSVFRYTSESVSSLLTPKMSEEARALNRALDITSSNLAKDCDRLEYLVAEAARLREQLATIVRESDKLAVIIACRKRDMQMIFSKLPLTQATPESVHEQDKGQDNQEDPDFSQAFLTQAAVGADDSSNSELSFSL